MNPARIVAEGFEFPEGPAFAADGSLFLVNLQGGYLSRIAEGGRPEVHHHTGGRPNGLAIHRNADLYVADSGLGAVIRIDQDGKQHTVVDSYQGERLRGPNDLCFDRAGNLYFTDPLHSGRDAPIGRLYRLASDGRLSVVVDGLAFPNGLCFDADERVLYLAESEHHRIHACTLDQDGACSEMSVYAEVEGDPDGMALDVEGSLYAALYGRGAVGVIPPGGGSVSYLPVHGPNPTNVAFRGGDLYLTEASVGTLQVLSVGVEGLPLPDGREAMAAYRRVADKYDAALKKLAD